MRGRRALRLALTTAVLVAVSPAGAHQTFWDRLRKPERAAAERVFVTGERARVGGSTLLNGPEFDVLYSQRTAIVLDLAGGAELPDPRIGFLLGCSMIEGQVSSPEEGIQVLRRALDEDPASPLTHEAYATLAVGALRAGDYRGALSALERALELEWDRESRAQLYNGAGQAQLALDEPARATLSFEQALARTRVSETAALALFGLAVAVDRSFDAPQALHRVRRASSISIAIDGELRTVLEMPDIEIHPVVDRHYYRALSLLSEAETTTEEKRCSVSTQAAEEWERYLEGAEPESSGAERARQHLRRHQGRCPLLPVSVSAGEMAPDPNAEP